MNKAFRCTIRVYIEDTDAGGIVYYVNYLKFMERARTEMFRGLGFSKPAIIDDGLLLVVASAQVNYRKSARLDDELTIMTSVNKLAKTYVVLTQRVYCGEQCLCEGEIKIACVTRVHMKPARLPAEVQKAITEVLNV